LSLAARRSPAISGRSTFAGCPAPATMAECRDCVTHA
jgi:hypothetical protein